MWKYIEYLRDPHLVLCIQQAFGITPKDKPISKENKSSNESPKKTYSRKKIGQEFNKVIHNGQVAEEKEDEDVSSESDSESKNYVINNLFWYYVFVFGTELGDEIFYATFIPFWLWNIDGAVGRRIVMVWTIVMYIGQGMKDIVCWPRPSSPPVFRLQQKWALEYGMPSTHAMVGVSIPFSVFLYTMKRYEYPLLIGLLITILWCSVISLSRLYLGMHSVLDVVAGLFLALLLMLPLVPLVDLMDMFILTSRWSPLILLSLSIGIIVFYPKCKIWTPTRGDTTMVVSVCVGIQVGAWANYQLGRMTEPPLPPPYSILWPSYDMMGLIFLRCALGFSCIVATRALCKSAGYATLCIFSLQNPESPPRPSSLRNTIELTYKYITYVLIGFNTVHLLPNVFELLRIDRPTFYTEI